MSFVFFYTQNIRISLVLITRNTDNQSSLNKLSNISIFCTILALPDANFPTEWH